MASFLNQSEYSDLQQALDNDSAKLIFSRAFARQFYLHVKAGSIASETGESALVQKLVIILMLTMSVLLIFANLALVIEQFGWPGIFAAPIIGIIWTILIGFTTEMGSTMTTLAAMVLSLIAGYLLPFSYGLPLVAFGLSVVFFRAGHILASRFLHELLSRSYDAYNNLYEQIEIERSN
ncbi:MAG: hypothetical protein ACI8Z1_003906 [Candidatus Azotimanducaceae bacterium]|jgi:hypothetical protein